MPNTRFAVSAILAVLLLAGACGGDEDSTPAEQTEDGTPAEQTAGSTPAEQTAGSTPAEQAEGSNSQAGDASPDASSIGQDAIEPDTQEPSQSDTTTTVGPAKVQLGNRFDWCSNQQSIWDEHDEALSHFTNAEIALTKDQALFEAATDELDKIAAREAVEKSNSAYTRARRSYRDTREVSLNQMKSAFQSFLSVQDSSRAIAFGRAWEDFASKIDSQTMNVLDAYFSRGGPVPAVDLMSVSQLPDHLQRDPRIVEAWDARLEAKDAASRQLNGDALIAASNEADAIFETAIRPIVAELAVEREAIRTNGEAVLSDLIAGSDAYTAFRQSLQESCQE